MWIDYKRGSMTLNTKYSDLCQHLSIRVRVAFALSIAERVLPSLAENSQAFHAARKALDDCWQWENGDPIRAVQLYDRNDEELVLQGSIITDGEAGAAISAVTSAFYYTLWQAFGQDLTRGLVREGEVPMMGDVTEETVDDLCNSATQTSQCDDSWIASIARNLLEDFGSQTHEDLGPTVSPNYFKAK